jgi:hypothetical protein
MWNIWLRHISGHVFPLVGNHKEANGDKSYIHYGGYDSHYILQMEFGHIPMMT